jgi:hypothetical protein
VSLSRRTKERYKEDRGESSTRNPQLWGVRVAATRCHDVSRSYIVRGKFQKSGNTVCCCCWWYSLLVIARYTREMNVRNRIATFEVRNEEVRHQTLASPTQSSSSPTHRRDRSGGGGSSPPSAAAGGVPGGNMKKLHLGAASPNSNNNSNNNNNIPSLEEGSKPPSTTSLASQSRIQRLRNSHGMGTCNVRALLLSPPIRDQQETGKSNTSIRKINFED